MSRSASPIVRPVSEDEGYNWMHRAFLQSFQTHSVLTTDEMKPILASIMSAHTDRAWSAADITQPHLSNTIQTINTKIESYDYEIRSTKDQHTKESVWALVNNASDALTQFATTFSAGELGFVRRVLDYMFDTNNTANRQVMAIKHTDASNLARGPRRGGRQSQINGTADEDSQAAAVADLGISISEADTVLDSLVSAAFFQKSKHGYFSLAPRALMELRSYLKETYNEPASAGDDGDEEIIRIRDCYGCQAIVTYGIRCNNRECGVRWHDHCATIFYKDRRRREDKKCPSCGTECEGNVYVGERVETRAGRGSTGSGGGGGGGRRRMGQEEVEEEEEDAEEDEDE
ncbi:hypothetical protein EJ02DRAFT_429756 [Clathrospora elynae]|uniref:Non-structural maintenance of chromosomes element 1 homolog n=1 Tax=Clathrospora elynae TaxID=706981 RepID=A0A6A5T4X1_9PLEO|nr:hypothetical protein EJ02DRAFT_429756 [Clathrospora elynae]